MRAASDETEHVAFDCGRGDVWSVPMRILMYGRRLSAKQADQSRRRKRTIRCQSFRFPIHQRSERGRFSATEPFFEFALII